MRLKLNKIYYKNLLSSLAIVIIGFGIIIKEVYPIGAVSDNYFVLVMVVLAAFFGFFGIIALFMRFDKVRFRRKFVYSFFGVINFCIGFLSIPFAIMRKTAGVLAVAIYVFSFLIGVIILTDIFFGKREPKNYEREVLIQ